MCARVFVCACGLCAQGYALADVGDLAWGHLTGMLRQVCTCTCVQMCTCTLYAHTCSRWPWSSRLGLQACNLPTGTLLEVLALLCECVCVCVCQRTPRAMPAHSPSNSMRMFLRPRVQHRTACAASLTLRSYFSVLKACISLCLALAPPIKEDG